jgi:ABC-2 type transport system ATP-binding protein
MQITFQSLSKKYKGKYALKEFNAQLGEGVYGLLGANGAGKTTLINLFVGILKSDNGTILINDKDIKKMGNEFLSYIGYMPQYPLFYREFTVMDFLLYMCTLKGIPKLIGKRRAHDLMEIVNLTDAVNKKIGALSGGMRQRVGIVQAMLGNPAVLILDEPTAGLDPQERIRFRNLIAQFSKGRTVLLATHIVSDVEFIANEVLILKNGELIRKNTTEKLEEEIQGKVWSVSVSDTEALTRFDEYKISNMQRFGENITLRLIAEERPDETAIRLQPNLEDVFLYYNEGVKG